MKKIYAAIAAIAVNLCLFAQIPQLMSYQAVIRDAGGNLIKSLSVGMQISILQGSVSGTVVYSETQTPATNANGLVSIEIGGGTGFNTIDWSNGPYFIKTETDPTGGTNYTITGTSELLSVPYAIYSKKAQTADYNSLTNLPDLSGYLTSETDPRIGSITSGYSPKWNGSALVTGSLFQDASGNVGIGTVNPNAAMDISSTSGGILIPRMSTTERDLISSPALGLQIYNISTNCFNVWNGSSWGQICPDCGFIPVPGNNGPICAGLTLDLTVVTIPGATYSWTGPNGFTSNLQNPGIPLATTAASGAYFVTATLNGCTSQPIATVATVTPSLGSASASYNSPLCVNNTLTFNATTIPGASYTWSGPNNYFSNIQNPGISNAQLSHAGTYYVTATIGSCSSSTSVEVAVNPVPAKPGAITGTSALLPPQTNIAYSIAPVTGAASYTWAYTGGGATINGQGSNSITIDFACGATGGNLTVTANNICGGASAPQSQSVMMNTLAQPAAITGTSPIILPQSGVTYSIPEVQGATSYTWTVPGTLGTIASGQGSTSITVDFSCGASGGVISVVANNVCGSSTSRTFPVSIASLATPGAISGSGTITYPQTGVAYSISAVTGATTYTWSVPSGANIASGQGSNSILVELCLRSFKREYKCNSQQYLWFRRYQ